MIEKAYEGRRVFVTGHTGFKGAWLSYWLTRMGADVTGYALDSPTQPSLFEALRLETHVRHVVADVRDAQRLTAEMKAARPDVVFHLAAQPLVREGYARPRLTFETNVMGTVNLLEAARTCGGLGAVVMVTSDKCYANPGDGRAFVEDDPMGGRDPYSASKGCSELVTAAYRASYFTEGAPAIASVRAGNVIGGGDWARDRIVPDCVRALVAGRPVVVRRPEAVRPWQHVVEPLAGYLGLGASLLENGAAYAGPWNFGPSGTRAELPVRWVVDHFIEAWGEGSWIVAGDCEGDDREAHRLSLDSAKAAALLGWRPVWDAAAAVRRTAAWYAAFYEDCARAVRLVDGDLDAYVAQCGAAGAPEAGRAT